MTADILDLPSRLARVRLDARSAEREAPPIATTDTTLVASIVVPTYRRPVWLRRCLQALLEQDVDPDTFEILVCDDGPDDATQAVVRTMEHARIASGARRPRIRYLPVVATQGPAGARNVGWRAARAPIVALTDDDTVPARTWLRRGLAAMRGGAVACAGRIAIDLPTRPTDYERDASGLARAEFATANVFVRRDALEAVGGFDERFTQPWREDSDVQFALMRIGRIERAPDAVVRHPIRPAPWGASLRQQRKITFDALLYKKHPALYRQRIRATPRFDYYAIVLAAVVALGCAVIGAAPEAVVAAGVWMALTARLCVRRLDGTSRSPSHVAEMAITSIAIPFLATFWRVVGAVRYRVWFW